MPDRPPRTVDPVAGVAAFLVPGLGHIIRGRVSRGVYAGIAVLGLFFYALFIGGIDTIDSKGGTGDKLWFAGAAITGPIAFGVDWVHQNKFKAIDTQNDRLRTGNPGEVRSPAFYNPTNKIFYFELSDSPQQTPEEIAEDGPIVERMVWRRATQEELEAGAGPPNEMGLGRLNEIAMLAAAVAGMLNLIVILDALLPTARASKGGAS